MDSAFWRAREAVDCPYCGAARGEPCTIKYRIGMTSSTVHNERLRALREVENPDFDRWWKATGSNLPLRQPRYWIGLAAFNAGRSTMLENTNIQGPDPAFRIISTLHTGETKEGVGSNLGEAIKDLYRPKLQKLRPEPDPAARGASPIFLLGAIGRATVRPIANHEYDAFQGAESDANGGPLVIEWQPDDFKGLMDDLGLDWPLGQTLTIVDATGITINGWEDNAYAFDVHFDITVTRAGQA